MPIPSSSPVGLTETPDLIVRGRRVVTPEDERAAAIHVRGGVISAITGFDDLPKGAVVHESHDLVVMPGVVDTHVHINEPGRTEWEGFSTATRAAAAGGITTLIEMPLNSIPATTSVGAFQEKLEATQGKLWVDTGFWGGVVPGNSAELRSLWEVGCFGFKCFLVESGVPEFARASESDLRLALPEFAEMGVPLLAHAEVPGPIDEAAKRRSVSDSGKSHQTLLESRPRAAENEAIDLLLRLGAEYDAHIHIVHLSSSDVISA